MCGQHHNLAFTQEDDRNVSNTQFQSPESAGQVLVKMDPRRACDQGGAHGHCEKLIGGVYLKVGRLIVCELPGWGMCGGEKSNR